MTSDRMVTLLSTAALVFLGALFLPQLFAPDSWLYARVLTPPVVAFLSAPLRLLFLILGALFASRSFATFERENPVRLAWLLLAVGLWAYVAAQSILAFYQLVLRAPTPFPSLADLFFVPATLLVAASLFLFLRVYRAAGLEVASAPEVGAVSSLVFLLLALFLFFVGRPVVASDAPAAERALNLAYPVLDFVLLLPAALLLRMTLRMRGGSLWKVWMALLVGFFFLAAGDILFAVFTTLGQTSLDPLLDLTFSCSYVLIARAVAIQYGILVGSSA